MKNAFVELYKKKIKRKIMKRRKTQRRNKIIINYPEK